MIHIHCHSDGSVLDGAAKIQRLVARAKELNMPALGISDHGNMIKAVEFQLECQKQGIKPIIGCEFYAADDGDDGKHSAHIMLIAKNNEGLKNLYRLNEVSYRPDNFYKKPRVKPEDILIHKNGLICTTACIGSYWGKRFVEGREDRISTLKLVLSTWKETFRDDFYVEIQPNAIPAQKGYNQAMIRMADELHIPVIASTDVHYVLKEDYEAHDTMLCMQTGKKKEDTDRFRFTCNDFYLKSGVEMHEQLVSMGIGGVAALSAVRTTYDLADKCNALIEFDQHLLPHVSGVANEDFNLAQSCNVGFLKRCTEGAFEGLEVSKVIDRIKYELRIIREKGYSGYFLIVEDFINKAHSLGIPVGGGRGSVCGSEVAFILGITQIEPLKYGLLFERFLNPDRNSPPDIDSDFDYERRGEMIDYVKDIYGHDHVAQIIAEGTLACNAVVRKVLSVYGYDSAAVNRICKLVPKDLGITLEKALAKAPEFAWAMADKPNELRDMKVLEGMMSHISTHAAGVAISPVPLRDIVPCMTSSEDRTSLITQWHKKHLEKVGVYKFDFLGLKRLTIVRWCIDNIYKNRGITIKHSDLFKIDLQDTLIYSVLNSGDLSGIFQFDAPAGKQTVADAEPHVFEDIVVCESICRPGVRDAQLYLENKKLYDETGTFPVPYYWVDVCDILEPTYGAIVYQEQTMLLMNKLAGWTLGKADSMRKVKNLEEYRESFVNDCISNGHDSELANSIFDRFSLEYSFNKSHAVAYGVNSAQDAWLKGRYRVEFMAAVMSMDVLNGGENIPQYIQECRKYHIEILPPDINKSSIRFEVSGDAILYPLTGISNVGEKAVEKIMELRPYTNLKDFTERVPKKSVNKRSILQLIKAGAFDSITTSIYQGNRSRLANDYMTMVGDTPTQMTWCNELCMQYEMDTLGITLTHHPLDGYKIPDFSTLPDGTGRQTAGIIREVRTTIDKNGKQMAFANLENKSNMIELVIFARTYEKFNILIHNNMKVSVTGKKEGMKLLVDTVEVL